MGEIKPVAVLASFVGNLLMGWGMFTVLQMEACAPGSACVAAQTWALWGLPVGFVITLVSLFTGAGIYGFSGLFLAIGIGSLGAGLVGKDAELRQFCLIFGGFFVLGGLIPLVAALLGGRAANAKRADAERLVATGARGVGTIIDVRDTGMTLNDDPRVTVVMQVTPEGGGPTVERRKSMFVSRVAIPQVGQRFPVWYDPADSRRWVFGVDVEPGAPADVRALFDSAAAPPAAGEPDPLAEIGRLAELRREGAISEADYEAAKDRLIAQVGR